MGNMSPYYFKTIFRLCVKCIPSFITIGGAVSEKNNHIRQTFVVLYIGYIHVAIKNMFCAKSKDVPPIKNDKKYGIKMDFFPE